MKYFVTVCKLVLSFFLNLFGSLLKETYQNMPMSDIKLFAAILPGPCKVSEILVYWICFGFIYYNGVLF